MIARGGVPASSMIRAPCEGGGIGEGGDDGHVGRAIEARQQQRLGQPARQHCRELVGLDGGDLERQFNHQDGSASLTDREQGA
jgi:hypothetical protein